MQRNVKSTFSCSLKTSYFQKSLACIDSLELFPKIKKGYGTDLEAPKYGLP